MIYGCSVITTGHVTVFYKINRAANLDNVYYNYYLGVLLIRSSLQISLLSLMYALYLKNETENLCFWEQGIVIVAPHT